MGRFLAICTQPDPGGGLWRLGRGENGAFFADNGVSWAPYQLLTLVLMDSNGVHDLLNISPFNKSWVAIPNSQSGGWKWPKSPLRGSQKSVRLRDDLWSPQSGDIRNPLTFSETYWFSQMRFVCKEFFTISFSYFTFATESTDKIKSFNPFVIFLKSISFDAILTVGDFTGSAICCSTIEQLN